MDLDRQTATDRAFSEAEAVARIAALEAEVSALRAELGAREAELDRMANSDPLTGLANRAFFLDSLKKAVSFARRSNLPLSVMLCDLNNFKFILDTYGHETRDRVLVVFAGILNNHTRAEDTVARFSGDEFFLLLQNTTTDQAAACAERMWETVKSFSVEGVSAKLSASFGIAGLNETDDVDSLLKRADEALFRGKSAWPKKIAQL